MGQLGQLLMPDMYDSFQQGAQDGRETARRKTLAQYVQPALGGDQGALAKVYGADPNAGMQVQAQSGKLHDDAQRRLGEFARTVSSLAQSGDMNAASQYYAANIGAVQRDTGMNLGSRLDPGMLPHIKQVADALNPQKDQGFTLGAGQTRYGSDGKVIASAPAAEPKQPDAIRELEYYQQHPEALRTRMQIAAAGRAPVGGGSPVRAPSGYRYKQDGSLEPIPGGPADQKAGAPAVPGDQTLTGDDYLKTLDPQTAAQVKALADGRMAFPTGTALKSPYWQGMLGAVSQYDPSFDAINYNARSGTRKGFTSGKEAQTVNSLNTVAEHLGTLSDYIQDLHNTSYPAINRVKNFFAKETGDPDIARFNTAKKAVADEVAKVWRASGGSEADIQENLRNLDGAQSPEQLNAAVATLTKLISGKIAALNDQYTQGMGKAQDVKPLVSPEAQKAFDTVLKRGGEQVAPSGNGWSIQKVSE